LLNDNISNKQVFGMMCIL